MSRETLKDFLNRKGSTDTFVTYTRKESPDGLGKDPGTNEEMLDLNNDLKGLLGEYVRFIMEEAGNEHLPASGNEKSAHSNRGDNLVLADLQGFESVHVSQGTELKTKLNEYSNSGKFDDLGTLIDKVGKNFSNHEKLKEIKGQALSEHGSTLSNPNGEDNDIIKATQNYFLKNNRFANVGDKNKKSFAPKPISPKRFEESKESNEGSISLQNKFGSYDKDSNKINLDTLKELGTALLLKSSGFSKTLTPGNQGTVQDVINNIDQLTSYNFNKQTGFSKIAEESTRAKNAKGFPIDESGRSFRDNRGDVIGKDVNANNSKSYGSTYNSEFKFVGSNKLHKIQAAISMIALKNVGKGFYETFINNLRESDKVSLFSDASTFVAENPGSNLESYLKGRSKSLLSTKIDHNIFSSVITNTTFNYGDAVDRGIEIVYGSLTEDDPQKVGNSKNLAASSGFWLAVSRSILKSLDNTFGGINSISDLTADELFLTYKNIVDSNKFIQFFNVMAIIGDASLASKSGSKDKESKNARDLDSIPDNRSLPGKSRKKSGNYKEELSWSQDASPSMYLLPGNILRAAARMNTVVSGENPARGMFGSKLGSMTYTGLDVDGSYNRIPNEVVKEVEDQLEAEYVPFYIQDLRTNEIVSFNAFLSSLSDSINPSYSSVSAYGRMDPVQIYQGTTRSLQVGFTLYATNREDFDSMWYKINKFITLLYPQWTPGTMVSNGEYSKFYQPFSQVIGASPIVRLRIGDVIKSNYSNFNLGRIFGIGDSNVSAMTDDYGAGLFSSKKDSAKVKSVYDLITDVVLKVWLTAYGSPLSTANFAYELLTGDVGNSNAYTKAAKVYGKKAIFSLISDLITVNGFANPLAVNDFLTQIKDPNGEFSTGYKISKDSGMSLRQVYLKPDMVTGYMCADTGKKYLINRKLKVRVLKKDVYSKLSDSISGLPKDKIGYRVICVDPSAGELFSNSKEFIVKHTDIYPDPKLMFNSSMMGMALMGTDIVAGGVDALLESSNIVQKSLAAGVPNELFDLGELLLKRQEGFFMSSIANPYVRAFESTMGRGLAGVIKSITFNWLDDFPWETEFNSRAPIGVKISFGFDVIHDLPPGLDHTGYNRAPLYNVGGIMRNMSGDVYNDKGRQAEFLFSKEANNNIRVKGNKNG